MDPGRMKGNLPAVLLKVLSDEGPLYGLEIVREVETRSDGVIQLTAGGLYPALRRLEKKNWVTVDIRRPPNGGGPVSFYSITEAGREALKDEVLQSNTFYRALRKVLQSFGLLREVYR